MNFVSQSNGRVAEFPFSETHLYRNTPQVISNQPSLCVVVFMKRKNKGKKKNNMKKPPQRSHMML